VGQEAKFDAGFVASWPKGVSSFKSEMRRPTAFRPSMKLGIWVDNWEFVVSERSGCCSKALELGECRATTKYQ
jgi:hypothetical protein